MSIERDLEGRVAIVTGGGTGIGAETTKILAAGGATVAVFSDRPTSETDILCNALKEKGGTSKSYQCDVSDAQSIKAAVDDVFSQHRRIDILVNSAGIFLMKPLEETSVDEVDRLMRINYAGTYNMIRAVLPVMREQRRGAIVNIASMAQRFASPSITAYAASKGAVVSLTHALVPELAHSGVRVNAVLPGGVRTPMTAQFHSPSDPSEQAFLDVLDKQSASPHGRAFIEPEDIAAVVVFLASDGAKAVHGAAIPVGEGFGEAMAGG